MGVIHFNHLFTAPHEATIANILNMAKIFPRFVNEEDTEILNNLVTLGEIKEVIKWFQKDKIPGPDGWPLQFYLTFFELIGQDLLLASTGY